MNSVAKRMLEADLEKIGENYMNLMTLMQTSNIVIM